MSLLVDLATEQLEQRREVLPGNPEELAPWKTMTVYKGQHHISAVGTGGRRYVDGRRSSTFGGVVFPTLFETEVRGAYMRRICQRSKWSWDDHDAMTEIAGLDLPEYFDGTVPTVPMACVDVCACYLQLMTKMSTQVEYRPRSGSWAPVGNYFVDVAEMAKHKAIYGSIATHNWRVPWKTLWTKGEPEKLKSTYLYQPQAWRLLCDILQARGQEARALYHTPRVLNDEIWVPVDQVASVQAWEMERWGLKSKVKDIWTPGEYWPLWYRDRLREQPDSTRDHLAWELAGQGGLDPCFEAVWRLGAPSLL